MTTKNASKPGTGSPKMRAADTGQRVYESLRQKAIDYHMRPGERVNEVRLSSELNVSRTPVRAALNRLVSEGLLTLVPNKGFFRPPIDIDSIRSLFEVRGAVEALSVKLYTERASDEAILALERSWDEFQQDKPTLSVKEIVLTDEAFHESIAEGSKNLETLRLLRDVNSRIRFLRRVALEREGIKTVTFVGHSQILQEVKNRNIPEAVALMTRHIDLMRNDVITLAREAVIRIYLGEEAHSQD